MTEMTCTMECGHKITWGESPEMQGASLPYLGLIIYCHECEGDQEIINIDPPYVVTCSEDTGTSEMLHVFYDCASGRWGFCVSGTVAGQYSETDDVIDFACESDALIAGRKVRPTGGAALAPVIKMDITTIERTGNECAVEFRRGAHVAYGTVSTDGATYCVEHAPTQADFDAITLALEAREREDSTSTVRTSEKKGEETSS